MQNIKKLGLIVLCTFLVSSVGLTGIPKASAHGTVDQTDLAALTTTTVSSGSTLRQGFTPTASNLVAVDLRLSCTPGTGMTVQILNNALAQIGTSSASCPLSGSGIVHFDYTSIPLSPGGQFFIQLVPSSSAWHASTSNPYPGGQAFVSGSPQLTTDFIFATYSQASPPPTISINDLILVEGNSGTTSFDFTVTRSGDTTGTSTVNFATADGTATLADSDYASNSGLLTFTAGQTIKTVSVLVSGDLAVEPSEQFFVNLSTCVGCNIGDGQGRGTITNDDSPPPGQVTGQVNIVPSTCGIAFVGGSVINYGDLFPGSTSAEKTLTLDNTGNTDADVALRGSHWLDGSGVNQMNVENTRFSTTTGPYALKTPLSLTDQPIDVVDQVLTPATNRDMFFQLQANLINPGFTGAATQTKIFTATC